MINKMKKDQTKERDETLNQPNKSMNFKSI